MKYISLLFLFLTIFLFIGSLWAPWTPCELHGPRTNVPAAPPSPQAWRWPSIAYCDGELKIRSFSLKNRSLNIGLILTRRHRTKRLAWVQQNIHLLKAGWRLTLFSDKSRDASFADRRNRVWCRPGERYADVWTVLDNTYRGGIVHVWRGFCHEYRTPLLTFRVKATTDIYIIQVLRPIIAPIFQNHSDLGIFQCDYANLTQ